MDITRQIAETLTDWMAGSKSLDTIKKVEARSGVGFGTVRRTKNGEGNITVQNLEAIAQAFGKHAIDLMAPLDAEARIEQKTGHALTAVAAEPTSHPYDAKTEAITELIGIAGQLNDARFDELIAFARERLALQGIAEPKPNKRTHREPDVKAALQKVRSQATAKVHKQQKSQNQ